MKLRKLIITTIAALLSLSAFAQTGGVKGLILSRLDSKPLKDAKVTIYIGDERKFV